MWRMGASSSAGRRLAGPRSARIAAACVVAAAVVGAVALRGGGGATPARPRLATTGAPPAVAPGSPTLPGAAPVAIAGRDGDAAGGGDGGEPVRPLVTLVPSDDDAITAALAAGLEAAFARSRASHGPDLSLRVSTKSARWGSAIDGAVRDAVEAGAVVIVAPPERRQAHLLSQLGTRVKLPVLSTSPAHSVVAAGSTYVAAIVPTRDDVRDGPPVAPEFDAAAASASEFVAAFRALHGRAPGPWDAVGYDAGRCAVEAVRAHGPRRRGLVDALKTAGPVRGAAWTIVFARNGSCRREDAEPR